MFDKWSNRSIMAARDAANRNTRRRRSDELIRLRDENGRLRAELRAALTAPADGCEWKHDDFQDSWSTGCGQEFCFTDGATPEEHGMRYCYHCGKPLRTPTTEGDTSCKTCGEVGEHHPDCTPQPGEDT